MSPITRITILSVGLVPFLASAQEVIWIEGERAAKTSAQQHGWYNSVKKEELSGGDWLNHYSKAGPAEAGWNFEVREEGEYEFWLRANPTAKAQMSWKLNGEGDWAAVDFSGSIETVNIASDGKIDMRFVGWVKVGKVTLPAGKSTLAIRMHSGVQNHGGLDCLVFSRGTFQPSGKLKPGEKLGLADEGSWAFEPGPDPISPDVRIDLSKLNEASAGMHGFVRHDAQGDFLDGKGDPIRFWAVNTSYHQRTDDLGLLRHHARWLARRGVNMIRSHSHLLSKADDAKIADVDGDEVERIWRLVAAMKEEGIYTTISPYWAVAVKWRPSLGIANPGHDNLTGMLFWDEALQEGYKAWWRALLTEPNPHTGIPLAKDPAVALLQLQNEDSLLFFTLQAVKGDARRDLRRKFHAYLTGKHGSVKSAIASWGGDAGQENDRPDGGEMGLISVWHLTQEARGARQDRIADQLGFYGKLMFDFNVEMSRFLREELGCRHLINAGNWHTASAAKLYDIERWSYTANEVTGANRYFNGGSHVNPADKHKSGYLISKGDVFSGKSVLRQPRRFPLSVKMPAGKPFIISESSWVPPLKYQSEGPFLVAAYSALTGFDAYYWFSMRDAGYGRPMGKWQMNTPMLAGQFPAAALMFRANYIQRGKPVLHEHRTLEDLWLRRKPLAVEDAGYDPNRDTGTFNKLSAVKTPFDPLGYLAGPVLVSYDSDPRKSSAAGFDVSDGVVTSLTGQLKWNRDAGICFLDAPKAQGATGFIGGRTITLSSLVIRCENQYATVYAVSADGLPLTDSKKILLQIGTTARPHGWKTEPDGKNRRIVSLGGAPWNVAMAKGLKVRVKNRGLKRAEVLDANFLKTGEVPVAGGIVEVPEDAMYLLLVE